MFCLKSKISFIVLALSLGMAYPVKADHPAAPACAANINTFTNSTPTAIPTGPAVVTATVVVSGVDAYLWDLDLTTTIFTHTFGADLDITLTSPAGTVVTLSTDNAAGNDNIFNGTLWDNDANPGGQVPYTTNNGIVTDHSYVNLTTATPITPEESFAAFKGEDPNGTWTITISDDLAGDGGTLDNWTLSLSTLPEVPTSASQAVFTQSTAVAIPTGPAVVTSTVDVTGAGTSVCDIDIYTEITHTAVSNIDMTVTSPAGTVVTLSTDNGASNDDVFNGTLWNDTSDLDGAVPYVTNDGLVTDHAYVNLNVASDLVPEESLGAFDGEDPNGTWTLTVSDDLAGDGGSINVFEVRVTTCTAPNDDADAEPNCNETCDADPLKTAPGVCGCGVADTDTDSDTTPDCNDACPADAGKIAAGVCGCGVADTDTDSDATLDCNDACPADAGKIAAGVCGCGVTDVDSDGDGTPDCIDTGVNVEINAMLDNLGSFLNQGNEAQAKEVAIDVFQYVLVNFESIVRTDSEADLRRLANRLRYLMKLFPGDSRIRKAYRHLRKKILRAQQAKRAARLAAR